MKIHRFSSDLPMWILEKLRVFETAFDYPLGKDVRFFISHGSDYLAFFRAMGHATLWLAEKDEEVLGTLVGVKRQLKYQPSGESAPERVDAHYLCDLKIAPHARGGPVLARLLTAAKTDIEGHGSAPCYAVVMTGTGRSPVDYTGRLHIPLFQSLAQIMVIRVAVPHPLTILKPVTQSAMTGEEQSQPPIMRVPTGTSSMRSMMQPIQVKTKDGRAKGWVEDTRRGKRLWLSTGDEMLSAHLSDFHFTNADSGAELVRTALHAAIAQGFPSLFFSVPHKCWHPLAPLLKGLEITLAQASVFGHALPLEADWWMDTAEI